MAKNSLDTKFNYPQNLYEVIKERYYKASIPEYSDLSEDQIKGLEFMVKAISDPEKRKLIVNRYIMKKSFPEIGDEIDKSREAVRARTVKIIDELHHPHYFNFVFLGYSKYIDRWNEINALSTQSISKNESLSAIRQLGLINQRTYNSLNLLRNIKNVEDLQELVLRDGEVKEEWYINIPDIGKKSAKDIENVLIKYVLPYQANRHKTYNPAARMEEVKKIKSATLESDIEDVKLFTHYEINSIKFNNIKKVHELVNVITKDSEYEQRWYESLRLIGEKTARHIELILIYLNLL